MGYVEITENAKAFIRKMERPLVVVFLGEQMKLRGGAGDPMGFHSVPSYNYLVAAFEGKDLNEPPAGFVKIDTTAGIPVYIMKPIFNAIKEQQGKLIIDVAGFWKMKRLVAEPFYPL